MFDCKNKIEKICTFIETINRTTRWGSNRPLACCLVYSFYNCTDFSNFIFAIKQGGLDKTFDDIHLRKLYVRKTVSRLKCTIRHLQGVYLIFRHLRYWNCGQIADLTVKYTKYHIHYNIFPTFSENFNVISQPWSKLQLQTQSEFEFKIYTPIASAFTLSDFIVFGWR